MHGRCHVQAHVAFMFERLPQGILVLAEMACSICLTSVHFKMLHSKAVPGRVTAESRA